MKKKTAVVTGAYGAIGTEIANGLSAKGFFVVLVGRDRGKLKPLAKRCSDAYGEDCCTWLEVDLSLKKEIEHISGSLPEQIDVLINNAATAPRRRMENKDGIELQWATNVLSYFWMIHACIGKLKQSEDPSIINVASYWAGGLDLDDPEFKHRAYDNDSAYRQSKQADRMLSYGLSKRFSEVVKINSCHPGDAHSKLSHDLGFGGSVSAKEAAQTPLMLALGVLGQSQTGKYFEHGGLRDCQFQRDKNAVQRLLTTCESY